MDIKVDSRTVIVFDLDDTLYNELDYLRSAFRSIAVFLESDHWKGLYSKMISMYRCKMNVFEFLATTYNLEMQSLIEMYRNHHPEIELFDGVLDMFKAIKNKNGKIGIITDGRSTTQRAKIEALGITNYIDKTVISEEIGSEKPDIANFKAIEKALPATRYYFIADNVKKDFLTPNALGWKSISLIDNGKNIHFESHKFEDLEYLPHDSILSLRDINII